MSERQPSPDLRDEPAHERLEATLERLSRERADADRRYNDALTALDAAIMRAAHLPTPPPPFDDYQLQTLPTRGRSQPVQPTRAGRGGLPRSSGAWSARASRSRPRSIRGWSIISTGTGRPRERPIRR